MEDQYSTVVSNVFWGICMYLFVFGIFLCVCEFWYECGNASVVYDYEATP